jgi:hypothetical protein
MYDSIQVKYNISMKIVNSLITEFSTSFFIFFNMRKSISLKLYEEYSWLLVKIILLDIFHEILDQFLFDFNQII